MFNDNIGLPYIEEFDEQICIKGKEKSTWSCLKL